MITEKFFKKVKYGLDAEGGEGEWVQMSVIS